MPVEFWQGYSAVVDSPPDFAQHRKLFQIYYLSVWTMVLAAQPELFDTCVAKLAALVA